MENAKSISPIGALFADFKVHPRLSQMRSRTSRLARISNVYRLEEVVPAMLEPILVRHGYADSNVMYVSRDNNFDCIEVSSDTN